MIAFIGRIVYGVIMGLLLYTTWQWCGFEMMIVIGFTWLLMGQFKA